MEMILQIWEFLSAMIGPSAPFFVIGYFGAFLILVTLPVLLKKQVDQFSRLPTRRGAVAAGGPDQSTKLRYENGKGEMLDKFSEFLEPQDEEELSAARLRLIQAGYRSASAVQTMNFAKMMMGVGFLAIGVLYVIIQPGEPTMSSMLMSILIPGGVGYMLPSYWSKGVCNSVRKM